MYGTPNRDTDSTELVQQLRAYKAENKLTYKQLAEATATTEQAIRGICKLRLTPSKNQVKNIQKALTSKASSAIIET